MLVTDQPQCVVVRECEQMLEVDSLPGLGCELSRMLTREFAELPVVAVACAQRGELVACLGR